METAALLASHNDFNFDDPVDGYREESGCLLATAGNTGPSREVVHFVRIESRVIGTRSTDVVAALADPLLSRL